MHPGIAVFRAAAAVPHLETHVQGLAWGVGLVERIHSGSITTNGTPPVNLHTRPSFGFLWLLQEEWPIRSCMSSSSIPFVSGKTNQTTTNCTTIMAAKNSKGAGLERAAKTGKTAEMSAFITQCARL